MNNIKIVIMVGVLLVLAAGLVSAHEHNFDEAKQLIDSGISCNKLTDEQLESIGEYYMEQMHPGEAHEMMDQMMGGEGSDSLKQAHIQMAKRLYCNEEVGGMMGSGGMMGGGMMNMMMGPGAMGNMMGGNNPSYGMMGNPFGYSYNSFWNIFWLVFLIGVIVLIIWLIYKLTKKGKESETPINILQKRYAKGEISKKQFDEMKKELKE